MRIFFVILFAVFCVNAASAELILDRKFALGGKLTAGNTSVQSLHFDFLLNRNLKLDHEFTVKGNFDKESSAGVDTAFKFSSVLRLAYSLSERHYHFYKLNADHDRFQDINLRLIPTVGMGYWFVNESKVKSILEGAVGYQKEYMLDNSSTDIMILRLSQDFTLGDFSNEFDVYANVADFGNFRGVNETKYTMKLNSHYALKLSLKDEYNNRPASGIQKNDLRFTTSIEYAVKETIN